MSVRTHGGQAAPVMLTVASLNVQYGAAADGRWPALAAAIRGIRPQLVLLQECDWLADAGPAGQAAVDLGLELVVAPSAGLPTAVAWDPRRLRRVGCDTHYATRLHHGYCAPRFEVPGLDPPLPVPLVVISTHLIPTSAEQAAAEASLVGSRAYRYGGLGMVGGDVNHCPIEGPEPDWDTVQPYNRMARCRRRSHDDEPWQGNTIVGQTLHDGAFTDVAAYVARQRRDPGLLRPTGRFGGIRCDQGHVTPALVPAIVDYWQVGTGDASDHDLIAWTLNLARIDRSSLREYT
jgi:hypothetical protein